MMFASVSRPMSGRWSRFPTLDQLGSVGLPARGSTPAAFALSIEKGAGERLRSSSWLMGTPIRFSEQQRHHLTTSPLSP